MAYKLDSYPLDYNDDSLTHAWVGITSFSHPLGPVSESLNVQNNPGIFWRSHYNYFDTVRRFEFRLVQPYLDNPPLGMWLTAAPSLFFGYRDLVQIPQALVRLPAILAGVLTLFLTYFLARDIFGRRVATIALIVTALTPYFVFARREAFLENFLAPLFLASLYCVRQYLDNKGKCFLLSLVLIAILCPWIKVVGLVVPAITIFWLLKNKFYKAAAVVGLCSLLSVLLYLAYAYGVGWGSFMTALSYQGLRGMSLSALYQFFSHVHFYEDFPDGWYVLQLLSMLILLVLPTHKNNMNFWKYSTILYLLAVLFTSGPSNTFPWYRYPLFPLMSMASAYLLLDTIEKPNIYYYLLLIFFGLTGFDLLRLSLPNGVTRIAFMLLLTPFLAQILTNKVSPKLLSALVLVVFTGSLALNSFVILKYVSYHCGDSNCLIPDKIILDLK